MDWFLEPFLLGFQQRALIGGLAYKAYQNYQKGSQPGTEAATGAAPQREPELLPPPSDSAAISGCEAA